jgi:hypothetical protein
VLDRRLDLLAQVASLPILFPRLRAGGGAFEGWIVRVGSEQPDVERLEQAIDEGIARLEPAARERIVATAATELATAWQSYVAEIDDEPAAIEALLSGAVVAALGEQRTLEPRVLAVIEEVESARGGIEPLALVLDATSLWSAAEGEEVEGAVEALSEELDDEEYERAWDAAIDEVAARHWTPAHEERLALLVARARAQLPVAEFPLASAAVLAACERFEEDGELRARLGRLLLGGTLGPLRMLDFALAA